MANIQKVITEFEVRLTTILNEIEREKTKEKRMNSEFKNNVNFKQSEVDKQPIHIKAGICLFIDSEKDAEKIHKRIKKLIKTKQYPIKEVDWFYSEDLDVWQFEFIL